MLFAFAFAFALAFALHLSFMIFKGIKTKEKSKTKKIRVRIRPFLDGYGLGTRIRATLARTLIPGPATDPHLRIRSPGACLKSTDDRTIGTGFAFLTDSLIWILYLKKVCLRRLLKRGNCVFCCEIWIKPKESSVRPFSHYSQVFTRVEGGIGGPNPPAGALGSPVKSSPNLFSRKIKLQYSCLFLRLLLHDLYGPSHI